MTSWWCAARALALTGCATAAACGGDDTTAPPDNATPFVTTLGVWADDTASFSTLADGAAVPVVEGFQGLVFANLALRADADVPAQFVADGTLRFDDTGDEVPLYDGFVFFEALPQGRVATSFRVGLSGTAASLDDRPLTLSFELRSHDGAWRSDVDARLVLRDAQCRHTPEGTFVCDGT